MRTVKLPGLVLFLSISIGIVRGQTAPVVFIDPTGTYKLKSKTYMDGEDAYGYYGDMRVKLINRNKIVIDWDVNKGAPSYNSGGINDTLAYNLNKAVFRTEEDSSCRIDFLFSKKGVVVTEIAADYNSGCGFGHAVVGDGIYKKISGVVPEIDLPH